MLMICLVFALAFCQASWPAEKGKRMIENFDLKDVTLQGDLRRQFDETRAFYLSIPNDDFLKPYRRRAGLPAPGANLGGCYISHSPLPQIISGLVRMCAATSDLRCRDKAIALTEDWAKCIAPDGFFFADVDSSLPPYCYDKWVGALVDMCVYADYPEAKSHLTRITDWAEKNLNRKRDYAQPWSACGEWYTLTENLLRAYTATGEERYRKFAETWEYTDFWKLIAEGKDIFANMPKPTDYTPWYHAYSHVNSFNGLGASYLVKSDRWRLDTLVKAWDFLMKEHILVTGGYGQQECLVSLDNQIIRIHTFGSSFETQCGSWAAFKMSEYLTTLTGKAKYGDWVELLLINGIGASIPTTADGRVFYYSNYCTSGGRKLNHDAGWPCCSGTRPQAIAEYHDLIYYKDADGLYINLYTASSVRWKRGETSIEVRQVTDFPESDKIDIIIDCKRKVVRFALRLRIPNWLASPMTASINGRSIEPQKDANGWAVVDREWKSGDKLTVTLPMAFRVSRPDPTKDFPAAVAYGPVTLAVRYNKGNPARLLDLEKATASFEPVPGERLNWRLKSDSNLLLRPFYQFKEGEPYLVYLDPTINLPASFSFTDRLDTSGEWRDSDDWITSNTPGGWVEFRVYGDSVRVRGYQFDDAGRLAVVSDGKKVGAIDEYGPNRREAASWEFTGLGPGEHKLRLEHLPDKSPESKGFHVNISSVDCGY
ncbi:MAG: glycoside hydrolase family 127 protein [Armatimonadota bacterium]|nr:glycoside hydrolase family 127 protein [Armatimonadota bacterium]